MTEDDMAEFRSVYPEAAAICTFNLHGTHNNDKLRFRRIASEMSGLTPSLCAFQEVISGRGIRETSAEIAEWMTRMTGSQYRTHFAYCHLFYDEYPEGVSVSSRHPLSNLQTIDLNIGLSKGLRPLMERYAASAETEIYGRKAVFVSVHLDHAEDPEIRLAQAVKLLLEIKRLYSGNDSLIHILAGDFNDTEDSPVMEFLKKEGYIDTYRRFSNLRGDTYTSSDPHKRIDYIMVKGDVSIQSAGLIIEDPELSDHKGVFAVIGWKS